MTNGGLTWRPQAVLFDLGSTLLTGSPPDIPERCREVLRLARNGDNVDAEAFVSGAVELDQYAWAVRDASPFEYTTVAFLRLLRDQYGLELDLSLPQIERHLYFLHGPSVPEPGIEKALAFLHQMNIPMAVVSNHLFSSGVLLDDLHHSGLDHYFAFIISSADYALKKPHPWVFRLAADRLGAQAELMWHVGDSLMFDVAGARGAGMTPIWYNPTGRERPVEESVVEFQSWASFVEFLQEYQASRGG